MTPSSFLLLLAPLAPQEGAEPPPQTLYFDGVAVQAGDAVITLSQLNRFETRSLQEEPVTTQEELAQRRGEILRELSFQALETQAAEELGLDPEAIRFNLELQAQEERAKIGAAAFAHQLSEQGTNAIDDFSDREAEYLRILWRRSRLGLEVADLRPASDRYIRPGQLHYSFRENAELLAPPQVRFQILAVPSAAAGGPELAQATCEEARSRVLEGEDFSTFVEDYGAFMRETQGVTPLLSLPQIADPELRELARGEVGDLSAVRPLPGPQGAPDPSQGYRLVLLLEKEVPPPPRYEDPDIQTRLRIAQTNRRDRAVLTQAQRRMLDESYSWVHPGLSGPARPAQAASAPLGSGGR